MAPIGLKLYQNAFLTIPATLLFFGIGTGLFAFYSDWDALEASRESLQQSNVWSAISQSQDETGELLGNQIDVRVL